MDIYDYTGNDPAFKKTDLRYAVFTTDQTINFNQPVYADSIVVKKIVNGNAIELTANVDWILTPASTDNDALAFAKVTNANFSRNLVKNIVMKNYSTATGVIQISIDVQRFRRNPDESYIPDVEGPEYSRALMNNVLRDIQSLKQIVNPINNVVASDTGSIQFLNVDLTGLAEENWITNEYNFINVPMGIQIVRPSKGSFYRHDISVKRVTQKMKAITTLNTSENGFYDVYLAGTVGSGLPLLTKEQQSSGAGVFFYNDSTKVTATRLITRPVKDANGTVLITSSHIQTGLVIVYDELIQLTENVDYRCIYANQPKTKNSHHASGVYEAIYFLSPIVGGVLISYHAYGGEVSVKDINELHRSMIGILAALKGNGYLTEADISQLPIIKEMGDRIDVMEEFHKHYLQRDYTFPIENVDHTDAILYHWYNIAFIWDNKWNIDKGTNDIGTFRIESLERKWIYEIQATVNYNDLDTLIFEAKTVGACTAGGVFSPGLFPDLTNLDVLKTRIIWKNNQTLSGTILQIGIPHNNYQRPITGTYKDTIVVTNKSGGASRWRLYEPGDGYTLPAETNIQMPCGNSNFIWTPGTQGSYQIEKFIEPQNGLPLWFGALPLRECCYDPVYGGKLQLTIAHEEVRKTLKRSNISCLNFVIHDMKDGVYRMVSSRVERRNGNDWGGGDFIYETFYLPDLCGIGWKISNPNQTDPAVFEVITHLGSHASINDRFILLYITANIK